MRGRTDADAALCDLSLTPPPPYHPRWPIWRDLSEADWQAQVLRIARQLGWRCYHTGISVRSEPGYPDLHCLRRGRSLFLELKSERGSLTENQRDWLWLLRDAGHEAYVMRPHDEDVLEDLLR